MGSHLILRKKPALFIWLFLFPFISPAFAIQESELKDPLTVESASKKLCNTSEIYYHSNGNVALVRCMKNGIPEGKAYSFYPDGTTKSVGSHRHGEPDGEWTRYYPNGQKKDEGEWNKGKPDGDWTFWNEDGSVQKKVKYDNGEILPEVVHSLDVAAVGGLGIFTTTDNYNNYDGCVGGGPGQPCYGSEQTTTKRQINFDGGILIDYHIWRKWMIEAGVLYKTFQFSTSTAFSANVTPPSVYNVTQTLSKSMIAFPVMWRFLLFHEHLSLGMGMEFRAFFPSSSTFTATAVAGNPPLPTTYYNINMNTSWIMPVLGVAYRTQITERFGIVADFRIFPDDIELLGGVSYRLLK